MAEPAPHSRPALECAALRAPGGMLALEPLAEGRLILALAAPGMDPSNAIERLAPVGRNAPHAVRPLAPGQWLVVSDDPIDPGELRRFGEELGPSLALSDQSHGRVRLAVDGALARQVLARGTGVDLSERMFPIGRSAQTLFGHIGTHVTRVAADRFELIVLRSLAHSLWEELAQAAAAIEP